MNITTIALSFLLGVCVFQTSSHLPPVLCLAMFPFALLLLRLYPACYPICIAAVAYCWTFMFAIFMIFPQLNSALQNKDVLISGAISEVQSQQDRYSRFVFEINEQTIRDNHYHIPQRVILNWYQPKQKIHVAQLCKLTVRLKKHWRYANPGSFDKEKQMFMQGIGARGYVRTGQCDPAEDIRKDSHSVREEWLQKFKDKASKFEHYRLMSALSFGDRDTMQSTDWQTLRNTGTSHLLAISGLHLSAISAFVFLIVVRLTSCSATVCNRWPAQKVAALIALLAAFFYAYLAGFSLPTQRALIMVTVGLCAIIFNKPIVNFSVLSMALLIVLIINPMSTLNAGFWMSFLAVFFIFVFIKCVDNKSKLVKILFLQCFLGAALFPISLWFFSQASIIAPVVNIIAVPVVSFIILPSLLVAVVLTLLEVTMASHLLVVVDKMFNWLWMSLETAANISFSSLDFAPTLFAVVTSQIGLLILIQPNGLPAKYLAYVFLLSLFLNQTPGVKSRQLRVTVLDVGQGLSVVLETMNHTMVYDAGPRSYSGFSTGHSVVLPYLQYRGIAQADLAVVSHNDKDHSGGMHALIDTRKVRHLMVSNQPHLYKTNDIKLCRAGDEWYWDDVKFEVLHQPNKWQSSDNNRSCVIKISHSAGSILLTGDIEKTTENWLIDQYGDNLGSDLLLVPHHGSTSSSSYRFVGRVHPQTAVFSAGYMNRYGFPHATIMQRYQEQGVQLVDITYEGAVTFLFDAEKGITTQPGHRIQNKRYWHSTKE